MKTLTKSELLNLLNTIKGATFISMETNIVPKLKANNPFIGIKKVSKVSGVIGFNYSNSVNNQRAKEGVEPDFKPEARKWGERISNTPLVKHKDKFYLELKVQNSNSDYFLDGKRVNPEEIKPWYYNKSSRQELDNEVILRDYSLDNIKRIKINKEEYSVV